MSNKRRRKTVRTPVAVAMNKPLATRDLKEAERLQMEQFLSAQDAVIQQANVAANLYFKALRRLAKLPDDDGWLFNRDRMRWEQYPVAVK